MHIEQRGKTDEPSSFINLNIWFDRKQVVLQQDPPILLENK